MLFLLLLLSSGTHGLSDVSAEGSGVGLSALTSSRKLSHVADASVGLDVLQTLYVCPDFSLQITFDAERLNNFSDFVFLFNRKILSFDARIHLCLVQYIE